MLYIRMTYVYMRFYHFILLSSLCGLKFKFCLFYYKIYRRNANQREWKVKIVSSRRPSRHTRICFEHTPNYFSRRHRYFNWEIFWQIIMYLFYLDSFYYHIIKNIDVILLHVKVLTHTFYHY